MTTDKEIFRDPDLSNRQLNLTVERLMNLKPETLFNAWTKEFDVWFAAPGSVLMTRKVNTPFFFETEFKPNENSEIQRSPHYGRFLQLVPNQLIKLTWVTGTGGTKGIETVVTVELKPKDEKTLVKLTHSGFPDEESKNGHQQAWPMVLEQLEKRYTEK
ncbi:SRPBCC domain-containing protein [Arenibacter sp. M-2]|uniref:SRPBCC family protein n=1 Tax=Arenibacter sp. M-2 TaxID=3053612 RepID=UPI0025700C9F|nr:SRPBCC domain-containing protein [Arenibacter sp. M-2]MDL5513913.1 SRPBCC domain-containing protein [Arenibacter sp. M-2]